MNELILRASPLVAVDDAAATGAMASAADGTGCIPPLAPTARALSATVSAVVCTARRDRRSPLHLTLGRVRDRRPLTPTEGSWAAEWPTDSSM